MHKSLEATISAIKILFFILLAAGILVTGLVANAAIAVVKESPEINPHDIKHMMDQTSVIVTEDGQLLEKIESTEFREIVSIDQMPQHLLDAFIAVEDERFASHNGIDLMGIARSIFDNLRAGKVVQGGSTITQQLTRNMYLNNEVSFDRKFKEMYLAMQIEEALSKREILEAYLNRVFLGQNAYGVQAAAQTYFSKDVQDLSLVECVALASIVQSPTNNALFRTYKPEEVTDQEVIDTITIGGQTYIAVANTKVISRMQHVLNKMLELGSISQEEHDAADPNTMVASLDPGRKNFDNLSSYFSDLLKSQVITKLMDSQSITRDKASDLLYNGGLTITATIDVTMQNKLEDFYANFSQRLHGNTSKSKGMPGLDLKFSKNGNILNDNDAVIYYKQSNLLTGDDELYFPQDAYKHTDAGIILNSSRVRMVGPTTINITDFYTKDADQNLLTHDAGFLSFEEGDISQTDEGILISQAYLNAHPDFAQITGDKLIIGAAYFEPDKVGVVQPQSSTVVIDHHTGQIKALIGGRGDEKGKISLNRASSEPRQPGSTIKPFSAYIPAIDRGDNLATAIDDIPHYNDRDERWPRNWYGKYRGLQTIRESLRDSINVNTVKVIEDLGIDVAQDYLAKFGIINADHPNRDTFVDRSERAGENDVNYASLGLGAFTDGATNLTMTAAYAAIANKGTYIEPLTFSKIVDADGNVLFNHNNASHQAVDELVAYQIHDVLVDIVEKGASKNAQVKGIQVAGKTGTTQHAHDFWFVGYTPYYTVGCWIGADNQQIWLEGNSSTASSLWGKINAMILDGLEDASFEEPEGLIRAKVCSKSGKLPTRACYADPRHVVIEEIFTQDNLPTQECEVHVFKTIQGRRISIVNRAIPYLPRENEGIIPDDWGYTTGTGAGYPPPEPVETETETEKEVTETEKPKPQTEKPKPQTEKPQTEKPQTEAPPPPQTEPAPQPIAEPATSE